MAEHTPTPWFRNGKCEVGPRPRTDDQSDGMLHPVADVFGDNAYADSAFIVEACNNHARLTNTIDLLEKNAGIQAKLLADTARQRDALVEVLEAVQSDILLTGHLAELVDRVLADVGGVAK